MCDIIATVVVYLQFRIVVMYYVRCRKLLKRSNLFINSVCFFLHDKTNDNSIDLYTQYQFINLL